MKNWFNYIDSKAQDEIKKLSDKEIQKILTEKFEYILTLMRYSKCANLKVKAYDESAEWGEWTFACGLPEEWNSYFQKFIDWKIEFSEIPVEYFRPKYLYYRLQFLVTKENDVLWPIIDFELQRAEVSDFWDVIRNTREAIVHNLPVTSIAMFFNTFEDIYIWKYQIKKWRAKKMWVLNLYRDMLQTSWQLDMRDNKTKLDQFRILSLYYRLKNEFPDDFRVEVIVDNDVQAEFDAFILHIDDILDININNNDRVRKKNEILWPIIDRLWQKDMDNLKKQKIKEAIEQETKNQEDQLENTKEKTQNDLEDNFNNDKNDEQEQQENWEWNESWEDNMNWNTTWEWNESWEDDMNWNTTWEWSESWEDDINWNNSWKSVDNINSWNLQNDGSELEKQIQKKLNEMSEDEMKKLEEQIKDEIDEKNIRENWDSLQLQKELLNKNGKSGKWTETGKSGEWRETVKLWEWTESRKLWKWTETGKTWEWTETRKLWEWTETGKTGDWTETGKPGERMEAESSREWTEARKSWEWTEAGKLWEEIEAEKPWEWTEAGVIWPWKTGNGKMEWWSNLWRRECGLEYKQEENNGWTLQEKIQWQLDAMLRATEKKEQDMKKEKNFYERIRAIEKSVHEEDFQIMRELEIELEKMEKQVESDIETDDIKEKIRWRIEKMKEYIKGKEMAYEEELENSGFDREESSLYEEYKSIEKEMEKYLDDFIKELEEEIPKLSEFNLAWWYSSGRISDVNDAGKKVRLWQFWEKLYSRTEETEWLKINLWICLSIDNSWSMSGELYDTRRLVVFLWLLCERWWIPFHINTFSEWLKIIKNTDDEFETQKWIFMRELNADWGCTNMWIAVQKNLEVIDEVKSAHPDTVFLPIFITDWAANEWITGQELMELMKWFDWLSIVAGIWIKESRLEQWYPDSDVIWMNDSSEIMTKLLESLKQFFVDNKSQIFKSTHQ